MKYLKLKDKHIVYGWYNQSEINIQGIEHINNLVKRGEKYGHFHQSGGLFDFVGWWSTEEAIFGLY